MEVYKLLYFRWRLVPIGSNAINKLTYERGQNVSKGGDIGSLPQADPPPPLSTTCHTDFSVEKKDNKENTPEHRTSKEPRGSGWGQTKGKEAVMLLNERPLGQIYMTMTDLCMCKAITCWPKTNLPCMDHNYKL